MSKFGYMKKLEVTDEQTARYTINEMEVNGVSPTLILRPMTAANKPYFNAVLKQVTAEGGKVKVKGKSKTQVDAALLEEGRNADRAMFPEFILAGWEGVVDEDGNEVEFNQADAADFIAAIPDWIFDPIRTFCGQSENFVDGSVTIEQTEETAKN